MEKEDEMDDQTRRKSKRYSNQQHQQQNKNDYSSTTPKQPKSKKPEMARYQPPGNRTSRHADKQTTQTPPPVKQQSTSPPDKTKSILKNKHQQQQQHQQTDLAVLSGKRDEPVSSSIDFEPARSIESPIEPIRIPIHINKTNHKGGILKLNSAALNELNKKNNKINDYYEDSENSNHYHHQQRRNSSESNQADQAAGNYKMLFDPNNPNKPILVKEKSSKNFQPNFSNNNNNNNNNLNAKRLSGRYESKKLNETAYTDDNDLDNTRMTNQTNQNAKSSAEILKVKNITQTIKPLEESLGNLIDAFSSSKQPLQVFSSNIMPLRKKLEQLCIDATFTHIETASFTNIDLNHWRSCYHHLIETMRKELNNLNQSPLERNEKLLQAISSELKSYLEDGNRFYAKFVEKLEEYFLKFSSNDLATLNYSNSLDSIRTACQVDMTIKTKNMKLALMCINRCWIAMGDLARYEEMIFATTSSSSSSSLSSCSSSSPSSSNCSSVDSSLKNMSTIQRDYSVARYYYLKAMSIAPKSSRAYHQLAILAVYTKRRLDAVYYYFRCLEVNIPLSSVRQALNSLFDEARIKSDAISKFINNAKQQQQQNKRSTKSEHSHRNETWYKPSMFSSVTSLDDVKLREDNSSESDLDNDSDLDLGLNEEDDEDNEDDLDDDETSKIKELSTIELNKRFMHNYLNTIGKLFIKVGMETYHEVCSRMLHEFKELLRRQPCPLQKTRLLQITVINISLIDLLFKSQETKKQNETTSQFVQRSQLVESAIQLSIDMFVLMCKRFTHVLSSYCEKNPDFFLVSNQDASDASDESNLWRQLFPSIKIFIDWMLCNSKLWQPLPDLLPPDLGPGLNRWQIMSDMLNLVYKLLNAVTSNAELNLSRFDLIAGKIKLEEDLELVGFVPLLSLPCEFDPKIDRTIDLSHLNELKIVQIRDKKRMEKLCLFADYLCGLEQPYLKYDVLNKCYCPIKQPQQQQLQAQNINLNQQNNKQIKRLITTSICSNNSSTSSYKSNDLDALSNNFDDMNLMAMNSDEDVEPLEDDYGDVESEGSSDFNQLKERHRILKEKINEQEKLNQNVLDNNTQRRIELEIRPKFVVPDTNCFIDHLDLIDKILQTNYYILIVPLLVINELDKLSKSISSFNDDSLEHAQYVQRSAKKAINYLNEKFDKRDRNLKAITSQGSILETIQFRSEELKTKGTNDELILGCCLHFVHDNARDFNKTDRIHLYREVVLLTEDRHLRLKSHTRNVPVRNIIQFCKWSNLLDNRRFSSNSNRSNQTSNAQINVKHNNNAKRHIKANKKFIPNR